MIRRYIALLLLLVCYSAGPVTASTAELSPLPEHSFSTVLMAKFIDQYHYKKTPLDDALSSAILDQYIETIDPNRSFFTQHDIDSFAKYRHSLDDALRKGDLNPAFKIFQRFNQRSIERAKFSLIRLEQKFDFSLDEVYQFDRSEAAWAKDTSELDEIWRQRIKNDVLTLTLAHKSEEALKKTLRNRYERINTRSKQFKAEDIYEIFTNAYLQTIEPHTAYFSPRTSENFKINMSLSLEGIGALLKTVDEHTVVQRIITGGPADVGDQLHAQDRIIGVGQGDKGEVEDVVGWRIDDVVNLIRGPKDSIVRLQILPKATGVDGPSKTIVITRNKIKLEEQQVKRSIINIPNGEQENRIGVITIPTFYMDFEGRARGDKNYRSTTRDTKALINELIAEDISGIVIDLRSNGGGSLPEAVSLTGLFIESGPIVQIKDNTGEIDSNDDTDKSIAYTGPLVVLVDRLSASASEIFAGAIQDYGRGTILGEPTFGKGTVQTIVDLNRFSGGLDATLGQLKITMAQFFRVNGDSTQHRGVVPDIIFPTAEDNADHGERSLDNALPWAHISAAKFSHYDANEIELDNVKLRHQKRTTADSGFNFLLAQAEARQNIIDKKSVTLLKTQRQQERENQEVAQRERLNLFRISRGLAPVTKEEEEQQAENDDEENPDDEKLTEELKLIKLREAASILVDIITLPHQDVLSQKSPKQAANRL